MIDIFRAAINLTKNFILKVVTNFLKYFVSPVHWDYLIFLFKGKRPGITDNDKDFIYKSLKAQSFIILTRRSTHLTTYLITLGHRILTGHKGYWSHACMNVEGDEVESPREIVILESTGKGVTESGFDEVFDCTSCSLLLPRYVSTRVWENAVAKAKKYVGFEYDSFGDLNSDVTINCVELILLAVKTIPDYEKSFSGLLAYVKKYKTLTPDMLEDCGSFTNFFEVSEGRK
jgi:hypothetical protein